jgi:hypothetical protein
MVGSAGVVAATTGNSPSSPAFLGFLFPLFRICSLGMMRCGVVCDRVNSKS